VQVEVIDLINDGSGLGFGIIGAKGIGVIIKTIIAGGVSARVGVVLFCCCLRLISLRSADHGDLIVPRVQTQRYGSRSFRVSGPTVWNSLPQNLQSSDISREQLSVDLRHGCLSVLMCRWRI